MLINNIKMLLLPIWSILLNFICKKLIWYYFIYKFIWLFILKWFLWDFTSIRFIITKSWRTIRPPINPETGKRPPSTFFIWLSGALSVYVALFSIASQRYESRVDVIENRANTVFSQLSIKEIRTETLSRVSYIQNMQCPSKPIMIKPISVFLSLFSEDTDYLNIVELMRDTIVIWKKSLENTNLLFADLTNANLEKANLKNTNLKEARLRGANLNNSTLQNASLVNANLQDASLESANLQNANLNNANLFEANLRYANLTETVLSNVNLQKAYLENADLKGVDLSETKLEKANFENTKTFLNG